jgi:hypothetical protein
MKFSLRFQTVGFALLVSLALALFPFHSFSADLNEGLDAHWTFDEGSGPNVQDVSGNNNHGTIVGTPQWVPGIQGNGLNLVVAEKNRVEVPDSDSLDAKTGLTICAWINLNSIYAGDAWQQQATVLGKAHGYYLTINNLGNLQSYIYGPQPQEWVVGSADLNPMIGTWTHVATTYDGTAHRIYINGTTDAQKEKSGEIVAVNDNLNIGWVDYDRYLDGAIDEVLIWQRGLTEEEIQQVYTQITSVSFLGKTATIWGRIKTQQ